MPPRPSSQGAPAAPKPAEDIHRDAIWSELATVWARPAPALLIGLGRRRAGKSWVLARFARAVNGIYYQDERRAAHP